MRKLLILLFLPFLILIGCNKDDDQTQEQITPETFVKSQNEIISVSENTVILTGNQSDIEANDIIVSGANENAPYGFLRKVTSKSSSNGNTILQTQRTTISEAVKYFYEEGEVYEGGINYTFQPGDESRNDTENTSIPITISIDETITTDQGGVPIEINLSGNLTIVPNFICNIKISNHYFTPKIDEFNLGIITENNFNVSLNTEVNASFDTNDIKLGDYSIPPVTILVGIPIVIVPKFTLYIGAHGELNASILYTYNNNSTATAGVTYNNEWQYFPENGFLINSQSATATASVSGDLKAYVKPELSLALYDDDFISSGISIEPYARFEGTINSDGYSWLINGGIGTGAFFKVQTFGFDFIEIDREWSDLINIPEWEIASGDSSSETISNPVPADNSTITEQPITFSWETNNFTITPTFEILLGQNSNTLNSIGTTNNTNYTYSNNLNDGTYFWKVVARDSNNAIITESLIFSFTLSQNSSINPVTNPSPGDGETNVALNGTLSFTESSNTPTDATFKVYFDTNTNPTTVYTLDSGTNTLNYSNLQEGTPYYWKVETISSTGTVLATSPVWGFTTINNTGGVNPAFNPTPNNGANDIVLNGSLTFNAGANTPAGATFNLYFDTNTNPTTQYNLGSQTSYSYSNLQENTTYYWKIETVSNTGTVLATSNVWDFTTQNNTSGGVYQGDVGFSSQQELDDFALNNYTEITGGLAIGGYMIDDTDIHSLAGLASLTSIGGGLQIITKNNSLVSLNGLHNLNFIGGLVLIDENENLNDLVALNNITQLNNSLDIRKTKVTNLNNLSNITSITFSFKLSNNNELLNLNGLTSLTSIGSDIHLIDNEQLNDISALSFITGAHNGNIAIINSSLSNLAGLENITSCNVLALRNNNSLLNINSLANLTEVNGALYLENNPLLSNISGLQNISIISDSFHIHNLSSLNSLPSFSNLTTIGSFLKITENSSLLNINGFSSLSSINETLYIYNNPILSNINGLSSVNMVGEDLIIGVNTYTENGTSAPNGNLTDFCGLTNLITSGSLSGDYIVANNAYNPTQQDIIDGNCSQ